TRWQPANAQDAGSPAIAMPEPLVAEAPCHFGIIGRLEQVCPAAQNRDRDSKMPSGKPIARGDAPLELAELHILEIYPAGRAQRDGPGGEVGALGARPEAEI